MPRFYFVDEGHTLASALREALERRAAGAGGAGGDFVHCTVMHPLDTHLEAQAGREGDVREALLAVKREIRRIRSVVAETRPRHHPLEVPSRMDP